MDVRARGVDVGDEPLDDGIVVAKNVDGVAAENRHVAQLFGEAHGGRDVRFLLRMEDVRMGRKTRIHGPRELAEGHVALQSPLRHPPPAEHQVEREPHRRLEQDQQQPSLRGIRRTAERHDDQHDDADRPLGDDERREPDLRVRQERYG